MFCRHCMKSTDDVIVMQLMRFKDGELHSYANEPVVLCLDCYGNLRYPITKDFEDEEME